MAAYVSTEGFRPDKYFARSRVMLTSEPGWIKTVLLMWLAGFVPIAGPLGVSGYIVEWSRLTAWGVSSAPKQKGVQIGACIKSGWRAFLVTAGWTILWWLAAIIITMIPFVGPLVSGLFSILGIVIGLIIRVAVLRATIYQETSAGFKFSTIFAMIDADSMGLLRILAILVLGGIIVGTVAGIAFMAAAVPATASFVISAGDFAGISPEELATNTEFIEAAMAWLVALVPGLLIVTAIARMFANVLELIVYNALGLWMRQFNVPAWGGSDDPLPVGATQYTYYAQNAQTPYAYGDTDYGQQSHGEVGQTFQPGQTPGAEQGQDQPPQTPLQ